MARLATLRVAASVGLAVLMVVSLATVAGCFRLAGMAGKVPG